MAKVRKFRPFHINFSLRFNVLKGESLFSVNGGNLTVQCTRWDIGSRRGLPTQFTVTPINDSFWGSDGTSKTFNIGTDTKTWTDLENGDYFLRIEVNDHKPAILLGSGMVS